jgi:hypothetical protein
VAGGLAALLPPTHTADDVTHRLDVTLYYLRRVHALDYYSGHAYAGLLPLVRACGQYVVRARWVDGSPGGMREQASHAHTHLHRHIEHRAMFTAPHRRMWLLISLSLSLSLSPYPSRS